MLPPLCWETEIVNINDNLLPLLRTHSRVLGTSTPQMLALSQRKPNGETINKAID
jgi:hypothetical protein